MMLKIGAGMTNPLETQIKSFCEELEMISEDFEKPQEKVLKRDFSGILEPTKSRNNFTNGKNKKIPNFNFSQCTQH